MNLKWKNKQEQAEWNKYVIKSYSQMQSADVS